MVNSTTIERHPFSQPMKYERRKTGLQPIEGGGQKDECRNRVVGEEEHKETLQAKVEIYRMAMKQEKANNLGAEGKQHRISRE